jgi:hypothetical protein
MNKTEDFQLTRLFAREKLERDITDILEQFSSVKEFDTTTADYGKHYPKKSIYLYGPSGIGKTYFITKLLKQLGYDALLYDASDIRNKALFTTIDGNNLATNNVYDLIHNRVTKIAVVMDEIDGMSSGDKGGIDALIRLVRPKKTKKQRTEITTHNPIICIGNHKNDKKIRELMKSCHVFEMLPPTPEQVHQLMWEYIPTYQSFPEESQEQLRAYVQGDMNKFRFLHRLSRTHPEKLTVDFVRDVFQVKVSNEDAKTITCRLLNHPYSLEDHAQFMNETDRTTVALLWHENVARSLSACDIEDGDRLRLYLEILGNICFADYTGRITFQNQIWQFNEMCSLIKTFYNNRLLHDVLELNRTTKGQEPRAKAWLPKDIEFTKVLTKYSTEFNNQGFIYGLCQQMNLDRADLLSLFQELKMQLLIIHNANECQEPKASSGSGSSSRVKSFGDRSDLLDVENPKVKPEKKTLKKRRAIVPKTTTYAGTVFTDTEIRDWTARVADQLSIHGVDLLDIKRIYRFLDVADKAMTTDGEADYGQELDVFLENDDEATASDLE